MNQLDLLTAWYSSQCNGDWEHTFGIKIDTLDNPGWSVHIDLSETECEGKSFDAIQRGDSEDDQNWIHCRVEGNQFLGFGGVPNLAEILEIFLKWSACGA